MATKRRSKDETTCGKTTFPDDMGNPEGGELETTTPPTTITKSRPNHQPVVVRLVSSQLEVALSASQLWRLTSGCTSLPHNKDLVPAALLTEFLLTIGSAGVGGEGAHHPQEPGQELGRGRVPEGDVRV